MERLKEQLRTGLHALEERQRTWLKVTLSLGEDDDAHSAAARLCQLLKDPALSSADCNPDKYQSDADYVLQCRLRILNAIAKSKGIQHTQYLEGLANVVIWTMRNLELSYFMISTIIDQPLKYFFAQGDKRLQIMTETLKDILATFIPKTYSSLVSLNIIQPKFVGEFFDSCFSSLFPVHLLLNVFDSFLLEGVKIFYRYAVAIICLYKAQIKARVFDSAEAFWETVRKDALSSATPQNAAFSATMDNRLLTDILELSLANIGDAKNIPGKAVLFSSDNIKQIAFDLERSVTLKLLHPLNISRSYIQRKHDYYASRVVATQPIAPTTATITHQQPLQLPDSFLTAEQVTLLGAELPESCQWLRWQRCYAANNDGWDLGFVYRRVNQRSPCLILFYLQPPHAHIVLGALHGETLAPLNGKVRGNGRINRVFAFEHGSLRMYPWLGVLPENLSATESGTANWSSTELQFAVSAPESVTFGGSKTHFSNALRWEASDTGAVITGYSDTYANPPLFQDPNTDGSSFFRYPLREVEVYVRQ